MPELDNPWDDIADLFLNQDFLAINQGNYGVWAPLHEFDEVGGVVNNERADILHGCRQSESYRSISEGVQKDFSQMREAPQ
jgi:hypothetical protein